MTSLSVLEVMEGNGGEVREAGRREYKERLKPMHLPFFMYTKADQTSQQELTPNLVITARKQGEWQTMFAGHRTSSS